MLDRVLAAVHTLAPLSSPAGLRQVLVSPFSRENYSSEGLSTLLQAPQLVKRQTKDLTQVCVTAKLMSPFLHYSSSGLLWERHYRQGLQLSLLAW